MILAAYAFHLITSGVCIGEETGVRTDANSSLCLEMMGCQQHQKCALSLTNLRLHVPGKKSHFI
jgi:hypothetical protein